MERWNGKVALVTGASDGIGAVVAQKLVEHGMKVIGCARNKETLNDVATKLNKLGKGEMYPFQCDLKEEEQILSMFQFIKDKFGTMHVCVNNAAIIYDTSVLEGKTSVSWLIQIFAFILVLNKTKWLGAREESLRIFLNGEFIT